MQIDQEIRYRTEVGIIMGNGIEHEIVVYPGHIHKIAKTGNFFIQYFVEKVYAKNGHYEAYYRKWVKPTKELIDGFMVVEDLPKKKSNWKPPTRFDGTSYERCEHTEPTRKGLYCEICGVVNN